MNHSIWSRGAGLHLLFVIAGCMVLGACAPKQESQASFDTPDAAVAALVDALRKDDVAALHHLLGPETEGLVESGDPVADKAGRGEFIASYDAKHSLAPEGDAKVTLIMGPQDWPMPIPVVKRDGKWQLDGAAGADEVIYRRVGANELGAIDVCRGYVAAQLDYAAAGHDGDPAGIYALKLISDEGMHNGLYWATADDEPASPAGPFVAAAAEDGYKSTTGERQPYHGYYYRMLYAQGTNAKSGAREYFKNGVMTEGFALIAWPADYGASGVQTFIVNQDGTVFQKDLGDDTANAVETIKKFDPDSSWTEVAQPAETDGAPPAST